MPEKASLPFKCTFHSSFCSGLESLSTTNANPRALRNPIRISLNAYLSLSSISGFLCFWFLQIISDSKDNILMIHVYQPCPVEWHLDKGLFLKSLYMFNMTHLFPIIYTIGHSSVSTNNS